MATVVNHALTLPALQKYKAKLATLNPTQRSGVQNFLAHYRRPAAPGAAVPGASGAIPAQHLTGAQLANYAAQENQVNNQYGTALADYQFSRGNENQAFAANQGNLAEQYARMREAVPNQAIGRGLLNSGIYGGQLQDVASQRVKALSQLLQSHQQQLGGLDLNRSQAEKTRLQQLATIAAQRAAAQQALALQYGKR